MKTGFSWTFKGKCTGWRRCTMQVSLCILPYLSTYFCLSNLIEQYFTYLPVTSWQVFRSSWKCDTWCPATLATWYTHFWQNRSCHCCVMMLKVAPVGDFWYHSCLEHSRSHWECLHQIWSLYPTLKAPGCVSTLVTPVMSYYNLLPPDLTHIYSCSSVLVPLPSLPMTP